MGDCPFMRGLCVYYCVCLQHLCAYVSVCELAEGVRVSLRSLPTFRGHPLQPIHPNRNICLLSVGEIQANRVNRCV